MFQDTGYLKRRDILSKGFNCLPTLKICLIRVTVRAVLDFEQYDSLNLCVILITVMVICLRKYTRIFQLT